MQKEEIIKVLNALEGSSTFKGRTELYAAMGKMLKISPNQVGNLIKTFEIEPLIKTPKAKPFGDRKKKEIEIVTKEEWQKELKEKFPQHKGLVRDIIGGSRADAVKLMCLDCSNHIKLEITNCPILSCPLYSFRPYQVGEKTEEKGKKDEKDDGGIISQEEMERFLREIS